MVFSRKKSWMFVFCFIFVLISGTNQVEAQDVGVSMDVEPAYEGNFKYGEWLPLWVTLENKGQGIDATIEVDIQSSGLDSTYAVSVSLPSNARKRVPLYILPNNFSKEVQVSLISAEKTLMSKRVSVTPRMNINYLVGVIAETRGALSLIESVRPSERDVRLVDIDFELLPEKVEGLRSFDLIVINQVDTSRITPSQLEALKSWVYNGGRLVLGGGSGARLTTAGFPDSFLPVSPTEEVSLVSLEGLSKFVGDEPILIPGPFFAATGFLTDGTSFLAEHDHP